MIHILDYGLGNINAFLAMYKSLGIEVSPATSNEELKEVEKLILPGVGAFDHAIDLLDSCEIRQSLERLVLVDKVPVLGVCVGMQILASCSEEGVRTGLGWLDARVRKFNSIPSFSCLPMPHMGWNDVISVDGSPLFRGIETDAQFYFLHSYFFDCADVSNVAARADYGFSFDCAVHKENIYGVQFHPEKSHHWGATLLKNFAEL